MPGMTHVSVTALKDNVSIVTAVKKLRYRKVEGLENKGMPDKQEEFYENKHGITLSLDQSVELDITDAQLPAFQAAVNAGDIECTMTVIPSPTQQALAPTQPVDKKAASK